MKTAGLLILCAGLVLLAALGAGVFWWTVGVAAILLSAACLSLRNVDMPTPMIPASLILVSLLVLSLLPLPLSATRLTGERRYEQNVTVDNFIQKGAEAGVVARKTPWFSLTRNRAGTMRMTLLFIATIAAAILTAQFSERRRRILLSFLVVGATVIAITGYIGQWHIPQGRRVWWWLPVTDFLPGPVACFINPNHYAGFLAMLCPVALALVLDASRARRVLQALFWAASLIVMTAAVFLSLSRGAMLAYAVGVVVTAALLARRRRILGSLVFPLAVVGVFVALLFLPIPQFRARLDTLRHPLKVESVQTRLATWKGTINVWKAYPLIGAGAEALRMTYPQHRTTSERGYTEHTENEYLQLLAEGGILGTLVTAILCVGILCSGVVAYRRNDCTPSDLAGLGGALAVAASHSFYDFPLHTPLYTIVLGCLAGSMLSLSKPLPKQTERLTPPLGTRLLLSINLVTALVLGFFWWHMQHLDSHAYLQSTGPRHITRALIWAPTSWYAWYSLGDEASLRETDAAVQYGEQCMTQATRYDPNNYRLWQELGDLRLRIRKYAEAKQAYKRVNELRSWVKTPKVPEP